MKFKILIAVICTAGTFLALNSQDKLSIGDKSKEAIGKPVGEQEATPKRTSQLEKWMRYQNRKANFKKLDFEKLSPQYQQVEMVNDYRLRPGQRRQRKLDQSHPSDIELAESQNSPVDDNEMENIEMVEEQKRLILLQFYEVIREIEDNGEIADPRIAKLLTSYLQHLEYIYDKENSHNEYIPPVLYNYHLDQTIKPYCDSPELDLPEEEFLKEEEDEMVDLFDEYNSDKLHLIRKTRQVPNENPTMQTFAVIRKMMQKTFNGNPQESLASSGSVRLTSRNSPQSPFHHPKVDRAASQTQMYKGPSAWDFPIHDHISEYQETYNVNFEAVQNFAHMFGVLQTEYRKILLPVRRIDERIRISADQEMRKLTLDDVDVVVNAAKLIATDSNPHLELVNQLIVSFRRDRANDSVFMNGLKARHPEKGGSLFNHLASLIHLPLGSERQAYLRCIHIAQELEQAYDNFAYMTNALRQTKSSELLDQREARNVIEEVQKVMHGIIQFGVRFDQLFTEIIRNLYTIIGNSEALTDSHRAQEPPTPWLPVGHRRRRPWQMI